MGITNSNKVISANRIDCDGSLKVTLAITAAPDIIANPTDIALVLDRSGSMAGEPLASMKAGAKTFIDIIAEATGGTASGQIGSGSHIGIVSFSGTAADDTQLITSVSALKDAVGALTAGGSTNHADAFSKANGPAIWPGHCRLQARNSRKIPRAALPIPGHSPQETPGGKRHKKAAPGRTLPGAGEKEKKKRSSSLPLPARRRSCPPWRRRTAPNR